MFNDHLIFSNNIYDAAREMLQLQEAGLKKAKKRGASHETKHKELLRQIAREKAHKEKAIEHRRAADKKKGRNPTATHELDAFTHERQAEDIGQNIEDLTQGDTPKREFWRSYVNRSNYNT